MTTIKVRVRIDQKAALLSGKVLQANEIFEVTQEAMGPHWPDLVRDIQCSEQVWIWNKITLCDTDPKLLRDYYEAQSVEQAAAVKAYAAIVEERERLLSEPMQDARCFWAPDRMRPWDFGSVAQEFRNFIGLNRVLPCALFSGSHPDSQSEIGKRFVALCSKSREQDQRNYEAIRQANDEILAGLLPRMLEAQKAADEAENQKQAEVAAKTAEARKARWAERLASGYWTKETPSYNDRRHGPYWCASVSFADGPKPIYTWGESTGKWGQAGVLRVPCKPGDIVAWGQKDLRRPDKSNHYLLAMDDNGSMVEMSKTQAWKHWQDQHTVKA